MPSRSVVVVLRNGPHDGERNEEALRVAIGLTALIPDLSVLLLDGAAPLCLLKENGETGRTSLVRHWLTLSDLGVRRCVEVESLQELKLDPNNCDDGVELISRIEGAELLLRADSVMVF